MLIALNEGNAPRPLSYNLAAFSSSPPTVSNVYRTSATDSLTQASNPVIDNGVFTDTLPAQSVTTYVVQGVGDAITR